MKLVLKKQVGGVMGQPQQLSPELMQLLMSLPKDIQQYVLSLPIEQQIQELTILMQNQLKALQQSPNQNIQRSINQQPQIQQQQVQQVPQQIAQQQAMKYGGKKLQSGGDVKGKLVKVWDENDPNKYTWHYTGENGKPDMSNTVDVGTEATFTSPDNIVYDVKDYNSKRQSQESITTKIPKPRITTYVETKPKIVSGTGSAKGDAKKAKEAIKVIEDPTISVDNDNTEQADKIDGENNLTSINSSKEINPLFGVYVYNGLHLDRYGNDPTKLKTAFEGELNDIISVDNYINRLMREKNINATYNTEDAIMSIKKTPKVINHYKDLFKKIGLEDKIINEWENRLIKSGIYNGSNLSKNQTGGKLSIDSLINQQLQQKAKSQPTSNNVVLDISKPKSIGEKIANTAEFIDKWGTVAGILGQVADDGRDGWSPTEIAAAVVGNAVDLFNPLGKLGLGMKAVGKASKLLKVVNKADDAIKAGKAAKELEEMAVKSKKAYDFASKAPNIVSSAAGKLGVGLSGINTVSNIANVSDQILKSKDAFSEGNYGEGLGRAGFALLLGNQIPKNIRSSGSDVIEGSKMIYDKTGKALNAGKELVKESASTVKRVAVETAPKVKRGMSYLADSQLDEYQKLFGKIKSGLKQADEDLAEVGKNKTMNPKIKLAKSKNKPSEVEDSKIINLVLGIPSNISDTVGRNVLNMSGKINRGIQSIRDFRLRPEKAEIPVTSKKGIDNSNILNNTGEVADDSKRIVLSSTLSNPTDMSKTIMYGTKLSRKQAMSNYEKELKRHMANKKLTNSEANRLHISNLMFDLHKIPGNNFAERLENYLSK